MYKLQFVCVEVLMPSQPTGSCRAVNQYCAHSFSRNWQLSFLNQRTTVLLESAEGREWQYIIFHDKSPLKNVAYLAKPNLLITSRSRIYSSIAPDKRGYPHNIFMVSPQNHVYMYVVVLIRTHNICFHGEILKISVLFSWKKGLI